jgi:hypothetical protein
MDYIPDNKRVSIINQQPERITANAVIGLNKKEW